MDEKNESAPRHLRRLLLASYMQPAALDPGCRPQECQGQQSSIFQDAPLGCQTKQQPRSIQPGHLRHPRLHHVAPGMTHGVCVFPAPTFDVAFRCNTFHGAEVVRCSSWGLFAGWEQETTASIALWCTCPCWNKTSHRSRVALYGLTIHGKRGNGQINQLVTMVQILVSSVAIDPALRRYPTCLHV